MREETGDAIEKALNDQGLGIYSIQQVDAYRAAYDENATLHQKVAISAAKNISLHQKIEDLSKQRNALEHDLANAQQLAQGLKDAHAHVTCPKVEISFDEMRTLFLEAIERLAVQKVEEWQPIETAPKDQHILIYTPHLACQIVGWWSANSGWGNNAFERVKATHWMPLPESPK